MEVRQTIVGVLIFAIVTFVSYMIFNGVFSIDEGISVVGAIVIGFLAEVTYRKKKGRNNG